MYDRPYLFLLKLSGVPRLARHYTANYRSACFHAREMCQTHVNLVAGATAELVAVMGVRKGGNEPEQGVQYVTEDQVLGMIATAKDEQEFAAQPSAEDVGGQFPNRVLYERMFDRTPSPA